MRKLFTSESVTEGHPDKVCDRISDAVLDAVLAKDSKGRVACETCCTTDTVFIAGEITSKVDVDIEGIARRVLRDIGYTGGASGFDADIEALGTKFNVSAYPTDSLLTTTLLEGSVLLTTQNLLHPMVLKPNEQFVYNKRTRSALLQQVDANRFVSWTTGYYYFPEQSLEAILYRLSHVYGVQFTVKSEALKRRTFTGTFYRGQSIKDIMEIIHLSIPVRYKIDDHHVTISEI